MSQKFYLSKKWPVGPGPRAETATFWPNMSPLLNFSYVFGPFFFWRSGCFFCNILTIHFFGALVMVRGPRPNWTPKKSVIFFHKKESLYQLKITNILFNAFVRAKSKRVKSVQMFSVGTITKLVSKLEHNHAIQTQETDLHKSHRVK